MPAPSLWMLAFPGERFGVSCAKHGVYQNLKLLAQKLLERFEEGGKPLSMEELGGDFAPAETFPVKEVAAWRTQKRRL